MQKNAKPKPLWFVLAFSLFLTGFAGTCHAQQPQDDSRKDIEVKALAEVQLLFQATDDKTVSALARKWRFETPPEVQKQIIKAALKSEQMNQGRLRPWDGLDQFLHIVETASSFFRKEDNRTPKQRGYAQVIISLEFPFDPDLSKLYVNELYELAKSARSPRFILQQLVDHDSPDISFAARGNLRGRKGPSQKAPVHDLSTEGGRARWGIEQLIHCTLPLSGAMTEEAKQQHLIHLYEVLIDSMDMPFDPDLTKLSVTERLKLAWSEDTPTWVFEGLTADSNAEVRLALVHNREVPLRTLLRMWGDSDKRIATLLENKNLPIWANIRSQQASLAELALPQKGEQELKKLFEAPHETAMLVLAKKWRYETPRRMQKSILAALLAAMGSETKVPAVKNEAKPASSVKVNPLTRDKRLYAQVTIDEHPTLPQIIDRVRTVSGVELTIAPNLKDHKPNFGSIQAGPKGWFAYQLMGIATQQLENGRWEKVGDGYRLEGTSAVPPPVKTPVVGNPLRYDNRLYAFAHVEPLNPSVQHIAERVAAATGLEITISPALQGHKPKLGYIQPNAKGWRAYDLMEIATRKLANGRWEKTAAGYQLVGGAEAVAVATTASSPVTSEPPISAGVFVRPYVFGAVSALVILGCWVRLARLSKLRR